MKYVVGIGEALFDCLPEGRKLGGAPANFAYHVSQFGLNGCAISAIGDDELGEEIVETFEKVDLRYVLPRVEQPTGTVKVTLDDKGIPQYDICLGVAWDNIPLTDEMLDIARNAEAICFGSLAQRSEISRRTIHAFLDAAPRTAMKVFDINLRQQWYTAEVIAESLNRANVLNKVVVADTVGAGDSFTATFVARMLQGKSIREAHENAVQVSAFVCTQNGAMPELPENLK